MLTLVRDVENVDRREYSVSSEVARIEKSVAQNSPGFYLSSVSCVGSPLLTSELNYLAKAKVIEYSKK